MIRRAVAKWKAGEITWEMLVEVVKRIPRAGRGLLPPATTIDGQWEHAEEATHSPGTWDDLYLEWLFHELTDSEFHELETALLDR